MNDKDPKWETYLGMLHTVVFIKCYGNLFLGSPIRCIAANRKFIVACCEDLTINCYNLKSGARPLPPLLIEDLVSSLSLSQSGYCLVLTKTGLLHMWNFDVGKNILSRISVRCLLTGKGLFSKYIVTKKSEVVNCDLRFPEKLVGLPLITRSAICR